MALVNRVLGVVLGLLLAAAGVLLIVETIAAASTADPVAVDRRALTSTLEESTWNDPLIVAIAVGLVVVGLLLLLLQVWPRQPEELPLRGTADRRATVDRRALAQRLTASALEDPEVIGARASVTKKRASVRVRSQPGTPVEGIRQRITAQVIGTLQDLQLEPAPEPRVNVVQSRERGR